MSLYEKAIVRATEWHKGQVRKGNGLPYICHPLAVSSYVRHFARDHSQLETLMTAALLHDVVEDCQVSLETIEKEFGSTVANLVRELTSNPDEIKKMGKTDYLKQKMLNMSPNALLIKLCDRLDNVNDSTSLTREKRLDCVKNTLVLLRHIIQNVSNTVHGQVWKQIFETCIQLQKKETVK